MQFAGADQRVQHSCPLCRLMAVTENILFPPHSQRPDRPLHRIVIYSQDAITGIQAELVPAFYTVGQGFADGTSGRQQFILLLHPGSQGAQDRKSPVLADSQTLLHRAIIHLSLQVVQESDLLQHIGGPGRIVGQALGELTQGMRHTVQLPIIRMPVKWV